MASRGDVDLGATTLEVDVPCPVEGTAPEGNNGQPIRTTLCALLRDPDYFNGKMVQVRAEVYTGFEASLLRDGERQIWLSAGFLITMTGWVTSRGPALVLKRDAEYEKMTAYLAAQAAKNHRLKDGRFCSHCPLYKVWVDAIGRFEHVDTITMPLEQRRGAGFGHMNGYESQLVLESVSNVVATEIDTAIYEKRE